MPCQCPSVVCGWVTGQEEITFNLSAHSSRVCDMWAPTQHGTITLHYSLLLNVNRLFLFGGRLIKGKCLSGIRRVVVKGTTWSDGTVVVD